MRSKFQVIVTVSTIGLIMAACTKQATPNNAGGGGGGTDTTSTGGTTTTDTLGHSIILYGTTATGGDNDSGSIYKINGDGTGYKVVYSFNSQDGNSPFATLCKAPNGKLYGTATGGGANKQGTLFSFDPATATIKKIIDFGALTNGASDPVDLTLANNGLLYGGSAQYFFSIDPSNDKFTILHKSDFYTEGNISNCTQGKDGKLYGISYAGGARVTPGDTSGIIYSYDIQQNIFKRLYTFTKPQGMSPVNRLCAASDGNLYGFTHEGGGNNQGVIFSFNPSSGTYTKLIDFVGSNGRTPVLRNHLEEWNNTLYGVVFLGSTFGGGLINYDISANTETFLYKAGQDLTNYLAGPVSLLVADKRLIYINGISTTCAIMRYDPVKKTQKIVFSFPDAKTTIFGGLVQY